MFGNIFLQRCASFALLLLLAGSSVLADDTDVFTGGSSGGSSGSSSERPQVMIIFDNSGSMKEGVGSYDPSFTYPVTSEYPDSDAEYEIPDWASVIDHDTDDCRWDVGYYCKGNYLNWLARNNKLKFAKEAITTLISENPGIDFGLAVFNNEIYVTMLISMSSGGYRNYHGGHILKGLIDPDNTELINTINGIKAETATHRFATPITKFSVT